MPVLQKYNIIAQKKKYRTLNHTCLSNNFNCPLPERRRVTRRRMLRKMTMMTMTRAGGCSATSRQPSSASSSSQPSSPWEHTSSAPLKTSHSLMGSTSALSASQPSASGTLYQILKEVDCWSDEPIFFISNKISDTLGLYMTMSTVYILVGMTVFTTIIEIVRQQCVSTKYLHISIHVIYV